MEAAKDEIFLSFWNLSTFVYLKRVPYDAKGVRDRLVCPALQAQPQQLFSRGPLFSFQLCVQQSLKL